MTTFTPQITTPHIDTRGAAARLAAAVRGGGGGQVESGGSDRGQVGGARVFDGLVLRLAERGVVKLNDLVPELRGLAEQLRAGRDAQRDRAVVLGRLLREVKRQLGHGWMATVYEHCGVHARTGQRCIALAERMDGQRPVTAINRGRAISSPSAAATAETGEKRHAVSDSTGTGEKRQGVSGNPQHVGKWAAGHGTSSSLLSLPANLPRGGAMAVPHRVDAGSARPEQQQQPVTVVALRPVAGGVAAGAQQLSLASVYQEAEAARARVAGLLERARVAIAAGGDADRAGRLRAVLEQVGVMLAGGLNETLGPGVV